MEEVDDLLDEIARIGREMPSRSIRSLASELREVSGPEEARRIDVSTPVARARLRELVAAWRRVDDTSPEAVSLALMASRRTATELDRSQSLELLWTGPGSGLLPVRRIDQTLEGLIARAEDELLMVSFVVFDIPSVVRELRGAVERGVDVRLVLEFEGADQDAWMGDPLEGLGELPDPVSVYHWPYESRPVVADSEKRGYIHVKCAAADSSEALITSANLTRYGMRANMEMGVLVRGGRIPGRVFDHFDALIDQGMLQPYDRGSSQGPAR